MDENYRFDLNMQSKILALCLKEVKTVASYRSVFQPLYFENPNHQAICKLLLDYFDKYRQLPTLDALRNQVSQGTPNEVVRQQQLEELSRVYSLNVPDRDYVIDKTVEFAKHQAIKVAILKSVDHLHKGDYGSISREIEQAQRVGENALDIGRLYIEHHDVSFREKPDMIVRDYVPTMWKTLDRILRGGLYRGQLGVIMAPAKAGKSTTLINLGAAALQLGRKVFHYTLELNTPFVAERYDARITGIPINDLKSMSEEIKAKLSVIRSRQGEVVIKEYPTKSANIRHIRSHIHQVQSTKGYLPDLIIVDYGDLLRSTNKYDDSYREAGAVYEELRALAMEYDVPVWTASQGNRASFNKQVITLDDVAVSLEKVMVADVIISICQTPEEKRNQICRLFIAGGRTCASESVVPCQVDYHRMIIREGVPTTKHEGGKS